MLKTYEGGVTVWRIDQNKIPLEIELWLTIFGGIRITLLTKCGLSYHLNWCAGPKLSDVNYLLSKVMPAYESGRIIFDSKIKPYFNDPEFCSYLEELDTDESIKMTPNDLRQLCDAVFASRIIQLSVSGSEEKEKATNTANDIAA